MNLLGYWEKAKNLWQEDTTYTFYVVANNGNGVKQKTFHTNFFRKVVLGVGVVVAGTALTMGYMQHTINKNAEQMDRVVAFERDKAAQEKKLESLNKMSETVQKDMAALSAVEEQVRMQMQKSGMHVPKKSIDPAKYGGKGGNGDMSSLLTRMDVAVEQHKNMHAMLKAHTNDWQAYLKTIEHENYRRESRPNHWPLAGGTVTSRFGGRRDPVVGGRENHAGIDIGVGHGTPVYAAGAGHVEYAGWYYGYGNYIKISHGAGYQTAYGHLSSIDVPQGAYVKKGQFIGRVGSTGYSTGPHLHFEVLEYGKQVNPMKMF